MYKNFHLRTYRFSCGNRNRLKILTSFPMHKRQAGGKRYEEDMEDFYKGYM